MAKSTLSGADILEKGIAGIQSPRPQRRHSVVTIECLWYKRKGVVQDQVSIRFHAPVEGWFDRLTVCFRLFAILQLKFSAEHPI